MANLHLVTGYAGQEHITATDQGAFNAALIGTGQFVLAKGNEFAAQIISNNVIRVKDGELMMQGRFVRMEPGTYVDLSIENGAQGMMRNDLIVARYTKSTTTGIEEVNLVVIKGTAVASNPVDPAYTVGDITNGEDVLNDFPLWRIRINGLNVNAPVMLFEPFIDSMRTLPDIRRQVNEIHGNVDKQLAEQDEEIDKKIAELDEYTKNEVLTDDTKAKFGFGSGAVPNDVFGLLGNYNQHWWSVLHGKETALREYVEVRTALTDAVKVDGYNTKSISYSKNIVIDQTDGTVSLSNPASFALAYKSNDDSALALCRSIANLAPVYVQGLAGDPNGIYYIPDGANAGEMIYSNHPTVGYYEYDDSYEIYLDEDAAYVASKISSDLVITNVAAGEKTYVHSADSNAYQDGSTVGGKTYEYLGVPFANAVSAIGMELTTYVGTGGYGANNPCELKLNKVPKLMFISRIPTRSDGDGGYLFAVLHPTLGVGATLECQNYGRWHRLTVEVEGKTVKWYSDYKGEYDRAGEAQMNEEEINYIVTAFG